MCLFKTSCQKGFTLLELMVVISVIGILSAIAIPSFKDSLSHNGVNNAHTAILSHLKKARLLAVSNNRSVFVMFDSINDSYVFDANVTGLCGRCNPLKVELSQFASGINLTSTIGTLEFTGQSQSSISTITVSKDGFSKKIKVTILGSAYGS